MGVLKEHCNIEKRLKKQPYIKKCFKINSIPKNSTELTAKEHQQSLLLKFVEEK